MEMLDERKTKILKAIIRNYLETGEPGWFKNHFKRFGFEFEFSNHS